MQTIAFAVPVLPGKKAQLLNLGKILKTERQEEFRDFLRRLETSEENWYLQPNGDHDLCICYLAASNLARSFELLATSKNKFDCWIKDQNKEIFGIDFESNDGSAAMPEVIFEFKV